VSLANSYGSGSGEILLDDLQCTGDETSLSECGHRDWGVTDCTHKEDVSINCSNGISGLGGHIAISDCRSLSQSFGNTFFELAMVENPNCRLKFRRYLS